MGRRRKEGIAVYKPELHGRKWRVRLRNPASCEISFMVFENRAQAQEAYELAKDEAAREVGATVQDLLGDYIQYLRDKGGSIGHIDTEERRIKCFFEGLEKAVNEVTKKDIERIYENRRKEVAVGTHANQAKAVKRFMAWATRKNHILENPAKNLEIIGKTKRGKRQLRAQEARIFTAKAFEFAKVEDTALVCLSVLILGIRPSELVNREMRDLDPIEKTLMIPYGKTESAIRTLAVPAFLFALLWQRIEGKAANDPIVACTVAGANKACHRICRESGVTDVCLYSLRGLHSSLARSTGMAAQAVAEQLGHSSPEMTKRHYFGEGVDQQATQRSALRVLLGGLAEDEEKAN